MKKSLSFFLVGFLSLGLVFGLIGKSFAADATVTTPATANISSDSYAGTSIAVPNIVVTEADAGEIAVGTIILTAPAGYYFDTLSAAPNVAYTGAELTGSATATVTSSTLSVTISHVSTAAGTLTIGSVNPISIKAVAGTPMAAAGNILMTAGTITGITNNVTSFGVLTQVGGNLHHFIPTLKVAGNKTAGSAFVMTITAQDQYNNTTTKQTDGSALGIETFSFTTTATAAPSTDAPTYDGSAFPTTGNLDISSGSVDTNDFIFFNASETPTISVAADALTTKGGTSAAITVIPSTLAHFDVVVPNGLTGADLSSTIKGHDAFSNVTTSGWGVGAVVLTSDGGATVYPGSVAVADFTDGQWAGNLRIDKSGNLTVTATQVAISGTDTTTTTANKITTLTCVGSGQAGAIWLRWTEPTQTYAGLFTGYVVKRYDAALTDVNWGDGTTITQTWTPAATQGASVQQLVTGLNPGTTYYFGIDLGKAGDTLEATISDPSPSCKAPSSSGAPVDSVAPTSYITSPAMNAVLMAVQDVVIKGTARDTGGSSAQKVEVSTDGGSTWSNATVISNIDSNLVWEYTWVKPTIGSYTIKTRATDWVGNIETAGAGINVTVSNTAPVTTTTTTVPSNPTIASLMAQIASLQAQLRALQGGATCFNTNLKLGMKNNDIKLMQEKLGVINTGYFGPLTLAAVNSFQIKYRSEILDPLGLTSATGFVGASTRAKLNALYCK